MAEKNKNPHGGHRQRVREKFIKEGGFDSFPDHNVLEMLLFYTIPRSDTNDLAHKLIDTFGSLNGVFDAPYGSLLAVDGIGEQTAVFLKTIPATVKRYLDGNVSKMKSIITTSDAVEFLKPKFIGLKNEKLLMVCMDSAGKILKTCEISKGGSNFTEVDTRAILNEVITSNATQVIIAHNHPGGICMPSRDDKVMTRKISDLLRSINAKLVNHIIITETEYYSFATSKDNTDLLLLEPEKKMVADNDNGGESV